jgi:DNA-directed RNA polymerase specialized sigma subunit
MKIAKGLGSKFNFRNYSYLDDMISDAVFTCLKNIDCFDASRGTSAFAYFTQCVYFSFLGSIKNEKKKEQLKRDMFFKGDYDTFDLASEDEEFQLSYNEFIKSLGTDTTPYESDGQKKKKKFESKKSGLDTLFGEE